MKKKILTVIILGLFLVGMTGCGIKTNKYTGIYHDDDNDDTLTLNDDYSCLYGEKYSECTWIDNGNSIEFTYVSYTFYEDKYENFGYTYGSKEECDEKVMYSLYENAHCTNPEYNTLEARIVDNGLLIDGDLFEKIG